MENLDLPEVDTQTEPNTQENITPPQAGTSFFAKLKTNRPVVLGILGSLAIFTAIVYAVYSYSKRGQEPQPTPTAVPTQTIVAVVTPLITPTTSPTVTPTLNLTPLVTPTPDLTVDWKTYLSTKYGYSVKYPPKLEISSFTDNLGYETVYLSFPDIKNSHIIISEHTKSVNESFSNWVNAQIKLYETYRFSPPENTIINSRPAIYLEASFVIGNETFKTYFVYIEKDESHVADLTLTSIPLDKEVSLKSLFDQILSTFKFLE